MAYEKQTWKTGDVVTSAKLNHMEEGIANAQGYVVTHNETIIFDEYVTTTQGEDVDFYIGTLQYSDYFEADDGVDVIINFDGNDFLTMPSYAYNNETDSEVLIYGGTNTTPFMLTFYPNGNALLGTLTEGTHHIILKTDDVDVTFDPDFESAMNYMIRNIIAHNNPTM